MMGQVDRDVRTRVAEIEGRLARLWERNLGVTSSRVDDYFKSGGDSLRGAQLLAWIQESFGVELSLLDLFETRTIETQTRLLLDRMQRTNNDTDKPSTEYMFFGPADGRLFGALHRPASIVAPASAATTGIVACYPMGQEYMRIHRTYVELARSLAGSGRYVLRFDYSGCGDSAGHTTCGDFGIWLDNIRHAIRELRIRTSVRNVYVIGARIGANLLLELDDWTGVAGIVLWEPIVNGHEYLAALRKAHQDLLRSNAELDGYEHHVLPDGVVEYLGFSVPRRLHEQVADIDLLATARDRVALPPTLVLANSDKPSFRRYVAGQYEGGPFEYVATGESDGIWLNEDRQNKGVIPARAVHELVSWISRRGA